VTDPRLPGDESADPLLRMVTEHWHDIERLAGPQQRERLLRLLDGTAEPDPAEARAALADELIDLLPPGHPVIRALRAGVMYSKGVSDAALGRGGRPVIRPPSAVRTVPVTIYLADEHIHEQVEAAVQAFLATAGLRIEAREDPVTGSWFQRMAAAPGGEDPEVTARLLQNLPPLLHALHPTRDAVIRTGAVLVVKLDWVVSVFQLTAAQQAHLDHRPHLARSPHEIIAALRLAEEDGPAEPADPAAVLDLYVEDRVLGQDSRFLRETGVSFGRPRVSPLPGDELTEEELRRLGLAELRLSNVILPFDLEEPPDGWRYLETTVRMTFDSPDVESLRLSGPPAGTDGYRRPDDGLLDTRGVGRQRLTWKLTALNEQLGLRPTGREVLAVVASPQASERLTGTLDASVSFTRRLLGRDRKSTAEPRYPLRFTLNVIDGTFEAVPDQGPAPGQ
jgi:hypothetical protein